MNYFHVWFSPKNRKWLLQGEVRETTLSLIKTIAKFHSYELVAIEAMPDHIHILVGLSQVTDLSTCIRDLKGTSAREIFKAFSELKLDAHINNFCQRKFEYREVPISQLAVVKRYVETQDERLEDYVRD